MSTARKPWPLALMALKNRVLYRVSAGRLGSLEPAMAAPRGRTLETITRVHLWLYRKTDGGIGASTAGLPTLLLTTRGRKTGLQRTVPLPHFPHPDGVMVVGSFAGGPKNPAWFENLLADPVVSVQIGSRRYRAHASVASPEDRPILWAAITGSWSNYAEYARVAPREIPVVVLRALP